MRHGAVSYFVDGRPVRVDDVDLTDEGREQAEAARVALAEVAFDRVIVSGVPRTTETAEIVAPGATIERWPELRELEGRLLDLPEEEREEAFIRFFRDVVPEEARFLGGESVAELFDRVIPALERLRGDGDWDVVLVVAHGGTNRAILSYALTGARTFLGNFEQAPACINVLDIGDDDVVVRAVNVAPYDPIHAHGRLTTMEELWSQFKSM